MKRVLIAVLLMSVAAFPLLAGLRTLTPVTKAGSLGDAQGALR